MKGLSGMLFVLLSCAAAVMALTGTWGNAAEPGAIPRIGVLLASAKTPSQTSLRHGLGKLGYAEGKNIFIDWKTATEEYESLRTLADELVRAKVDLIVAGGDAASTAAMQSTSSIPIVFASGDPIIAGYAKSLSHPGTNATGMYVPSPQLEAKRLELLMQIAPRARRVAYLSNPSNPLAQRMMEETQQAAKKLGVRLVVANARVGREVDPVLKRISNRTADAALVSPDVILATKGEEIAQALHKARLPAIYPRRNYLDYGGLLYYGVNRTDLWDRVAVYVDRLLKGAKPTELPVEEVSKFELVINLREARALGIEVPQTLMTRADEVIR